MYFLEMHVYIYGGIWLHMLIYIEIIGPVSMRSTTD